MIDDATAAEMVHEEFDLVDRDGVTRPGIDAAALLERSPSVDPHQLASCREQRPSRVARIDRGVDLYAIGVLENCPGRILVAMQSTNDAVGHRWLKVGGQQKRIAHREGPVADLELVAVTKLGMRKIVTAQEFHQRDISSRIDADDHGVVELTVIEPTLHERAGPPGDVKIGQGVTIRSDQHS